MMEVLFVLFWIWWPGYCILASIGVVVGLIAGAIIRSEGDDFTRGEARFVLALLAAPVLALVWPVLLGYGIRLMTKNLWRNADLEGPLARRARLRREREIAIEAEKDQSLRQCRWEIARLERELKDAKVLS